jgi:hypothetical protein
MHTASISLSRALTPIRKLPNIYSPHRSLIFGLICLSQVFTHSLSYDKAFYLFVFVCYVSLYPMSKIALSKSKSYFAFSDIEALIIE